MDIARITQKTMQTSWASWEIHIYIHSSAYHLCLAN